MSVQKPNMITMPAHPTNQWNRYGLPFDYIVLHYVGAVSTARNNGSYYGNTPNIGASAHFFVDEKEIVSSVPLSMSAGHCGVDYSGGKAPFWHKDGIDSTNRRSIGIEMCCKKDAKGNWFIEPETVTRTVALVKWLMQEYKIPIDRVIRHYDVCWKRCPEPWVRDPAQWEHFKKQLMEEEEEMAVRYNAVSEMPAHYRDGAEKLIARGAVYFPSKIYKITSPLTFFSNQFLFFEPGATLLQGAGITALLLSDGGASTGAYSGVHDSVIYGATFDGADFEVNMSLVGICHSKNVKFVNCVFKNAYGSYHNLEINSSYNTLIDGCDFEGSRKTAGNGELIQIDAALSTTVYPWPTKNDSTVCKFVTVQNCVFHDSPIAAAIGNHSAAAHKGLRIANNLFDGLQSTYGIFQFASGITDIDIYGNTFNECSMKIGGIDSSGCVTNNRFINCTDIVGAFYHNNMMNGVWTV